MIINNISNKEKWESFLQHKIDMQHLSKAEENDYRNFINNECYIRYLDDINNGLFPATLPEKRILNKIASNKKRIVYSFESNENIMLKYIAWTLYKYDYLFEDNCYAFRRGFGVKDAIKRIKHLENIDNMYCLKVDIHNYFNSIDVNTLMCQLEFIKSEDCCLFNLFSRILLNNQVSFNGDIINENHGVMAGTPTSPFLANIYLSETDKYFKQKSIPYFRYSDDILIFADSLEKLNDYKNTLYEHICKLKLEVNPDKLTIYTPGDSIEFLGFSYNDGTIDLSATTIIKIKGKIKRKANALRRWARKKNLPMDKAAIGFIKSMNYKFFGGDISENRFDEFTWSKWFFPNITTDKSLKIIDEYMQEYIRYICTGRHYKGNYRINYVQLKDWGYRSLVHEYYSSPNPV